MENWGISLRVVYLRADWSVHVSRRLPAGSWFLYMLVIQQNTSVIYKAETILALRGSVCRVVVSGDGGGGWGGGGGGGVGGGRGAK